MYQRPFCFILIMLIFMLKTIIPVSAVDQRPYDFPVYGVDAICNATFAGEPDDKRHSNASACLQREQKAYDILKSIWKDAPAKIKDACQLESRALYSILYACVSKRMKQDKLPLQLEPELPVSPPSNH